MKARVLIIAALLGLPLMAMLSPSAAVPALALGENRPTSELALFQTLNGVQVRDQNALVADGGGLTFWTIDAGPGCNNVRTGAVYEMHCTTSGHFCPWNDGGVSCSSTASSTSYGRPVAASTADDPRPFFFIVPGDLTSGATVSYCVAPKSGNASLTCPLFRLK